MQIKDIKELNALHKLLFKVKFQKDLDFFEFREFASSPLIANIFERLNDEFIKESINTGYLKPNKKIKFNFDGHIGETIKLRIDELTKEEIDVLKQNESIEFFIRTLISPLELGKTEFTKIMNYAKKKFETSEKI